MAWASARFICWPAPARWSSCIAATGRRTKPAIEVEDETLPAHYSIVMAVLAWLTVLTGAYIIYPWYRAVPPPGTANLAAFPQRLLLSSPATIGWHSIGMEWKEHVAWLVPISITMAAAVFAARPQSQNAA